MSLNGSKITIKDNSGAVVVKCLRVYGYAKNKPARVGDKILASIKKYSPNKKITKTRLYNVLIITSRNKFSRKDGSFVKFDATTGVVVENRESFTPIASRINSPIAKELKQKSRARLLSLAKGSV